MKSNITCEITLICDDENKDYTVDILYDGDDGRFHSETTIIFGSYRKADSFVRLVESTNIVKDVETKVNIVVE